MPRSGSSKWSWIGFKKSPVCRGRRTTRMDRRWTFGIEYRATVPAGGTIALGFVLRTTRRERVEPQADAAVGRAIHEDTILWSAQDDPVTPRSRVSGQSETSPAATATDGLGSDLSETSVVSARAWPSHLSLPAAQRCHHATKSGVVERHHVYPAPCGFHLSGCCHGLVQPLRAQLGNIDEFGCRILLLRPGSRIAARPSGDLQHRSGSAVHQRGVHRPTRSREYSDQHGRPWPCVGQCLRRTSVENSQIRGCVPEGLQRSSRRSAESWTILPLLQPTAAASGTGLSNSGGGVPWSRDKGEDAASRQLLLMSFKGMRKSIRTLEAPANQADAPAHLSDEFPAGYSLTGCSPALPASASPAGVDNAARSAQFRGFFTNDRTEKRHQTQRQQSTFRSPFFCPKDGETLTFSLSGNYKSQQGNSFSLSG